MEPINKRHVAVIVAGRNRTIMTIENIRCVMKHLICNDYEFIIGSDRSGPGHEEALSTFLETTGKKFKFVRTSEDRFGLGSLINLCNLAAFEVSDNVMYIENDMILHKDLDIEKYLDDMLDGKIGCVNFRYMLPQGKCSFKPFKPGKTQYVYHIPFAQDSTFTVFGSTLYRRRYYELMGPVSEDMLGTPGDPEMMMDRKYHELLCSGVLGSNGCLMVIDSDHLTETYNDPRSPFYHAGLNCQHKIGGKWNPGLLRREYHILSDDEIDSKFRGLFSREIKC